MAACARARTKLRDVGLSGGGPIAGKYSERSIIDHRVLLRREATASMTASKTASKEAAAAHPATPLMAPALQAIQGLDMASRTAAMFNDVRETAARAIWDAHQAACDAHGV